jgi:hypothetical protein
MEHRIVKVTANRDFTLDLVFEGGDQAHVDLRAFVATAQVAQALRQDPELFATGVRIEGDGEWLSWPGNVDIDADALWYKARPEELGRDFGDAAA